MAGKYEVRKLEKENTWAVIDPYGQIVETFNWLSDAYHKMAVLSY